MHPSPALTERSGIVLPGLTTGFAAALALWCAWFLSHFPGLHLAVPARAAALLAGPIVVFFATGMALGRARALRIGAVGGVVAGLLSLLLLGALLGDRGSQTVVSDRSVNLALLSVLIVAISTGTGVIAALIGAIPNPNGPDRTSAGSRRWLFRFSIVNIAATAALLVLGAIVTSTESGMAVPDWPTTFSNNMFMFPMDHEVHPRIFFEHAHRLFGTFAGVAAIALMVLVLVLDPRRSVKIFAVVLFVAVVVQGILGAQRVLLNNPFFGIFHGILGQLYLGSTVAMAVVLAPTFLAGRAALRPTAFDRRLRLFATGFLHTLIVQLILGATFRHLSAAGGNVAKGAMHALYTHAAFAILVAVFATAAGFVAVARAGARPMADSTAEPDALSPALRRLGWTAVVSVILQIVLGVAALVVVMMADDRPGIPTHDQLATAPGVPFHEAAITTLHHANGVLLMGVSAALFMWGKFASPRTTP